MRMSSSQGSKNRFYWLAAAVFVLWSIGRVINPTLRAYAGVGQSPDLLLKAVWVYALLHVVVFIFTLWLLWIEWRSQGSTVWRKLTYMYVLVALILSLGFVAYDFGYLPDAVRQARPYPFDVQAQ